MAPMKFWLQPDLFGSDFGIGAESLVGGGTGPSSNAVGVGK